VLGLTKAEWKSLWAVLWRGLIIAPFLWVIGLVMFLAVLTVFLAPAAYVAYAFIIGDWFFGALALIGWFMLIRFGWPLLRWVFQGIEYTGI